MILKPCPLCRSERFEYVIRQGVDYEYGVSGDFKVVRCLECGLMFLNPRPSLEEVISFYPATYHAYQKPVHSKVFAILNNLRWLTRANQYKRLIGHQGKILDVGCGDGEVLEHLKKRGDWELWGLDFNKEVVEKARHKGLNVHQGVLEDVPLPKNYFDLIIMNHLVEHLEDPVRTLSVARGLLAPGGKIVGQLPNIDSWEYLVFKDRWAGFHFPRHLQFFSQETLIKAFRAAGFLKIRTTRAFHPGQWPISFENWVVSKWPKIMRVHGKTKCFGLYLLLCAPAVCLEYFCQKAGIMNFVVEKT